MNKGPFKEGILCKYSNTYYKIISINREKRVKYTSYESKGAADRGGGVPSSMGLHIFVNSYENEPDAWSFFEQKINWKRRLKNK